MRRMIVLLVSLMTLATMLVAPPASAETCEGIVYAPSDLGAIRPDSAWDLAAIEDNYHRCVIGDALYRAGVLPPAPEGYAWNSDYTLSPRGGYWYYDYYYGDWYYWYP